MRVFARVDLTFGSLVGSWQFSELSTTICLELAGWTGLPIMTETLEWYIFERLFPPPKKVHVSREKQAD